MKFKTIKYMLLLCLTSHFTYAQAQKQSDMAHILHQEAENAYGTWRHSANAAGLNIDRPSLFSLLEAGYGNKTGNFRRPQEASQASHTWLRTNGNTEVLGHYIQGYFNYERENRKDAEYNASLIDPFRNMPYIVADTNASDWVNQHYLLGFDIATPVFGNRWNAGLSVNYQASSGAKQRDVRARNNRYVLEIRPSIVYQINPKHQVGAHLLYQNHKEESNNYNVNVYVDQSFFLLYGLGHGIRRLGFEDLSTSRTTNYTGDKVGAGLQYSYTSSWQVFASADYDIGAENANIGFTNTRPEGTLLQKRWKGNLRVQRVQGEWGHITEVQTASSKSSGIEYINEFIAGLESDGYETRFESVRSTYNMSFLSGYYELIKNKGRIYDWKVRAAIHYGKQQDRYLIPRSHLNIEQLSYSATVHKAFLLNPAGSSLFSIGVQAGYSQNLTKDYEYGGSFGESLTVADLMARDVAYLSCDYFHFELPLTYTQRLSQKPSTHIFVKASGYYTKSEQALFTDRKGVQFSVGSTF